MRTIFLVEDGLTERQKITTCLQGAGYVVVSTSSVEEAQPKIEQQLPDLIVLDVILPGQSGFEFCRDLKKNTKTKNVPIIICSTKSTKVDIAWGTMLGADAFLQKPVDEQELLQTVRKFIGG
jgi:DNA-binding response OmpR family regulator